MGVTCEAFKLPSLLETSCGNGGRQWFWDGALWRHITHLSHFFSLLIVRGFGYAVGYVWTSKTLQRYWALLLFLTQGTLWQSTPDWLPSRRCGLRRHTSRLEWTFSRLGNVRKYGSCNIVSCHLPRVAKSHDGILTTATLHEMKKGGGIVSVLERP